MRSLSPTLTKTSSSSFSLPTNSIHYVPSVHNKGIDTLLLSVTTYLIHLPHGQYAHYLRKHHLKTAKELCAPRERIKPEKWTKMHLTQRMKMTNPCLSHQRRRHMAGGPTIPFHIHPRRHRESSQCTMTSRQVNGSRRGKFHINRVRTRHPHPSSYYHNISRLHSSLWTLVVNDKTSLYPPHSFVYCVFLHQSAHSSRGGWCGDKSDDTRMIDHAWTWIEILVCGST